MADPGRSHMTIWRMRIACWTPKATNTHSECVTLILFPQQQWLHERASVLRFTYTACRVTFTVRPYALRRRVPFYVLTNISKGSTASVFITVLKTKAANFLQNVDMPPYKYTRCHSTQLKGH